MKPKLSRQKIVAIHDFGVSEIAPPFRFRLEIRKAGKRYTGRVYRIERFRVQPTFPQDKNGEPDGPADDALLILNDEFIDDRKLSGKSVKSVMKKFTAELNFIFNIDNDPATDRLR